MIATPSSWRGGCLVPAIGMANCYGTDKRDRIEMFLRRAGIPRLNAHIRFYSDHVSDVPSFDFADEAVAVNPSKELRKIGLDEPYMLSTSAHWPQGAGGLRRSL